MEEGLYEQLITKLLANKLDTQLPEQYYIKSSVLDREEAARYLSTYLENLSAYLRKKSGVLCSGTLVYFRRNS